MRSWRLKSTACRLLQLLTRLSEHQQAPLLVFIDNLVLLDILHKWGKANFNPRVPRPCDIINFDVIFAIGSIQFDW
jgi:hypothetical protein